MNLPPMQANCHMTERVFPDTSLKSFPGLVVDRISWMRLEGACPCKCERSELDMCDELYFHCPINTSKVVKKPCYLTLN